MVTFDDFRSEWQGRRIDYDHTLGYQCVDLIRQYFLECFGLAGGGGVPTAIAYWTNTPADVLARFSKVSDGSVQKGDILILFTLGRTDYSGDGHIMIATGNGDPNSVEALEQNGAGSGTGLGQDAIRTRFVPRNRLAGVLRPIPVAPTPPDFQIVTNYSPARQLVITNETNRYNLNLRTVPEMAANPVGPNHAGDRIAAISLAQHNNGEYYFLAADSSDTGWNVKDCTDYVPPVIKPPAAPVTVPLAEKYTLLTTVMYFQTAEDAKQRRNAQSTIDNGEYYVVGRDEQAVKLSKDNKSDIGWVNTFDNKVETPKPITVIPTGGSAPAALVSAPVPTLPVDAPPVHDEVVDASDNSVPVAMAPIADITPTKPKPQYQWINNHAAQTMVSTNSIPITVHDLEGKYPDQQLPPNWRGEFSMYANVGGVIYYLPDKMRRAGWFFGIPQTMLRPVQQAKLDLNNDGRVNIADAIGIGGFIMTESKRAYTRLIAPVITDFKTEKAQLAKQRITKAIDGFSAGRKGKK